MKYILLLFSLNFFIFPYTFSLNPDLNLFFEELFPEERLSSILQTFSDSKIVNRLLKGKSKGVKQITPFSTNKNNMKLISIIFYEENLLKSFFVCLKLYPQKMLDYIQANKKIIPERFWPENLFSQYNHHYLEYGVEFYRKAGIIIPAEIILKFMKYYLKPHKYDSNNHIRKLSDNSFVKILRTIDILLSQSLKKNQNCYSFYSGFNKFFDACFEKANIEAPLRWLPIRFSKIDVKPSDSRIVKLLRLILSHGIIHIHDNSNIVGRIFNNFDNINANSSSCKDLLEEIMPSNLITYFFEQRKNNLTCSRLKISLKNHQELEELKTLLEKIPEKFFSNPRTDNRTLLYQTINVSKPFIFSKERSDQLNSLYNFYSINSQENVTQNLLNFDLLGSRYPELYHAFYSFFEDKNIDIEKKLTEATADYFKSIALIINQELNKQLLKISPSYIPEKDPFLCDSFEEIMENSQEIFNRILEINIHETWSNLADEVKNFISEKVISAIMRICLRQRNSTAEEFNNCIKRIIKNCMQIFYSSNEDTTSWHEQLEQFFAIHKNDSFKELLEILEKPKKRKENFLKIQKFHEEIIEKRNYIKFRDISELIHREVEEDKRLRKIHNNPIIEDHMPDHLFYAVKKPKIKLQKSSSQKLCIIL